MSRAALPVRHSASEQTKSPEGQLANASERTAENTAVRAPQFVRAFGPPSELPPPLSVSKLLKHASGTTGAHHFIQQLQRRHGNRFVQSVMRDEVASAERGPELASPLPPRVDLALAPPALPSAGDLPSAPPDLDRPPLAPRTHTHVQREESEEDSGLLSSIRSTFESAVSGLRSGWDGLSTSASEAFQGLEERGAALRETLGQAGASAVASIREGWTQVRDAASRVTAGVEAQLRQGVAPITGLLAQIKDALVTVNPSSLQSTWNALRGFLGGLWANVQAWGAAALNALGTLWSGLSSRFASLMSGLGNVARTLMEGLNGAARAIGDRLRSTWTGLQQKAADMSGIAGRAARVVLSALSRLFDAGRQLWSGMQRMWSGLQERLSGLWQRMRGTAESVWQSLRERAGSLWESVGQGWTQVREAAGKAFSRLTSGVRDIWARISGFSIGGVIEKFVGYNRVIQAVRQALSNPDAMSQPIVQSISSKLQTEMPARAQQVARERTGGERAPARPAGGGTAAIARTPMPGIMRQETPERSTALGEIWAGFMRHLSAKWAAVSIVQMVKDAIWTLIWPWPTVGREFVAMWEDLKTAAGTFFMPRGLSDPLGMLHDIWTNLLHVIDFPVIVWRRLNNILLALWGWFAIGMIVLGALGGAFPGTIFGTAAGAVFGGGVGGAPGGAAGGASGAVAGAGAGLGFALGVGYYLLISFAAAEGFALLKAWTDLGTGRQTVEEKEADYSQMADSSIALGVTAVLVILSAIAARIGAAFLGFVRRILPPRPAALLDVFQGGVRSGLRRVGLGKHSGRVIDVDSPAQLQAGQPWYSAGKWRWRLFDSVSQADFCDVEVRAASATAPPEGGPRLTLTPKDAVLPDGTVVTLKAKGFSWTPEALRLAMRAFREKFGMDPLEMGGEIDWANLENFQVEFAKARTANPGGTQAQWGAQAARSISFGKHRITVGYGDISARMSNFGDVTIKGETLQNVPRDVYIEARPTSGTTPPVEGTP